MKKGLYFFLILLFPYLVHAQLQGQARIDSLLQILHKANDDTNKVKLLGELSLSYNLINKDESLKFGEQGLGLATKLNWKIGIVRSSFGLGMYYIANSDYPITLEYCFKALKVAEEIQDKTDIVQIFSKIGYVYRDLGDLLKAMEYDAKALKIANELGDSTDIAFASEALGSVYKDHGEFPAALECYFNSIKIVEGMRNYDPKLLSISILYGDVGEVYIRQNKCIDAIAYLQKALKVAEDCKVYYAKAWALLDMGRAYLTIAKDTCANPARFTGNTDLEVKKNMLLNNAGKTALLHNAIYYLQQGLEIAKELHSVRTMRYCYENLAEACLLSGDYKNALDNTANFRAIKDSVFSRHNDLKIVMMEYEDRRAADSLKAAHAKSINDLRLKHQRHYTYLGFVVIALLSGFSFFIIKERKKSEKLLLNILPAEVAAELKSKGNARAKYFDHVTVLFTDFVNFNNAGERMDPQLLIDELDTCFKAFDDITTKYNIEKIKTIGDVYLAVGGLPVADHKHAENVVNAAIEISKFMSDRLVKIRDKTFEIRIGIHSGSVVAGIVGVKKFAYDIWGDTVNTAARMEQNSEPGKINISETTYELVKDSFDCEYRGEIEAKNKGMLKMYFVQCMPAGRQD